MLYSNCKCNACDSDVNFGCRYCSEKVDSNTHKFDPDGKCYACKDNYELNKKTGLCEPLCDLDGSKTCCVDQVCELD